MDNNLVDILVIGAGASSAAAVSNLSSLGVNILCLEQGDWMNTNEYPSNFKNWQTIRDQQFNQSPNIPKEKLNINQRKGFKIEGANFKGVGRGTILYSGHFPK
jgi:Predicted flavoprotein involved in K+ transport